MRRIPSLLFAHQTRVFTRIYITGVIVLMALLLLTIPGSFTAQASGPAGQQQTPEPGSMMGPESWVILPTMPADATQADYGQQIYILVCQACHADDGKGLTATWLSKWHPDDQNCWQSKCHATNHPPDGFEIPMYVPPIMGEDTLSQFKTAFDLFQYIKTTMPWQDPNSLLDEEYWQVTAFLLQANQLGDLTQPLEPQRASQMVLHEQQEPLQTTPASTPAVVADVRPLGFWPYLVIGLLLLLLVFGVVWRISTRKK